MPVCCEGCLDSYFSFTKLRVDSYSVGVIISNRALLYQAAGRLACLKWYGWQLLYFLGPFLHIRQHQLALLSSALAGYRLNKYDGTIELFQVMSSERRNGVGNLFQVALKIERLCQNCKLSVCFYKSDQKGCLMLSQKRGTIGFPPVNGHWGQWR